MSQYATIDLERGLGRVRGSKKLYRRMLGLFLNSGEFDAMEEALAAGDLAGAGDFAHAIKGMTGNLSLTSLFEISAYIVDQLRDGVRDDAAIERFRDVLRETRSEVMALAQELDAAG